MKLDVQRRIDRVAGAFICRILSCFSTKRTGAIGKPNPQSILVILLSEMGSLVLARAMFDRLKMRYPGASRYVLLFEQNREVLELIGGVHPENIVSVRNSSLLKLLLDSIKVIRRLRRIGIDVVVDCELFSRVSSIFSFLSGAGIRVGFHPHTQEGLYRGDFINRPVLYNPYHHISHQFVNMVEAIESKKTPTVKMPVPAHELRAPRMRVGEGEIKRLLKRFQTDFPEVRENNLVLVYAGGGLLPLRAWPLENFCTVAKSLIKKGYAVGLIGLEEDKNLAGRILAECNDKDCVDLTGYTRTIRELMIIFHFASLLITNDGGPGHFAAMTPIPAIILYGPETPVLYGPLSPRSFSFYVPLSCSPCLTAFNHRNSPCDGDNLCLKNISPQEVLEKSYELLEGPDAPCYVAGDDWK